MAEQNQLTWNLSDPGMDLLDRAGLAGLYMTLRAASEAGEDLSPLEWSGSDLDPDSVTVRWSGPPKPAFVQLMEWAWQVRDGVLYFPAVHDERDAAAIQNRATMHNGIFRTFLQHTNVQPKGEPVSRIITLDEGKQIEVRFQPPLIRPAKTSRNVDNDDDEDSVPKKLLRPWSDADAIFAPAGSFKSKAGLSGWAFPGIGGRYGQERKGKAWRGSPHAAFLLMLAPTICLYLRLPKTETKIKEKKIWVDNWVVVVPDIRDLREFAEKRARIVLSPDFADVASLGDAAMRVLATLSTDRPRRTLQTGCRVVAMGKVTYYPNQSVRKSVLDVPSEERALRKYRILHRELPNSYELWRRDSPAAAQPKAIKNKSPRINEASDDAPKAAGRFKMPAARGRIADNIITGRPWYADLTTPTLWDREELERMRKRNKELNDHDGGNRPTSHETILFAVMGYQRSKLMNLIVENEMWDDPRDRAFLEAFWETLSRLYFLERKAAEERGGSRTPEDRMNDLNDKIRRELAQAKTRTLLRKTLTEFFSKPASLPRSESLCHHVAEVWKIIDVDWQKGRDLALLALATYQSKEKRNLRGEADSIAN